MYSIRYKFGWLCQITLQKDHRRFPLSPAVSEHLFPTALQHQAVMHEASSRPGAPRPDTGKGHRCIHVFETWEAQLRWMQSAHSMLLTRLIFPLHSPGPLALKIAGRIAEFFPDAVLIMVRLGFQNGELERKEEGGEKGRMGRRKRGRESERKKGREKYWDHF